MVDDVLLNDGESYYAIVRATNAIDFVVTARSDGITIQLEPLIPGSVRDGDLFGIDLNFWPHIDNLSANWDGFGSDHTVKMENFDYSKFD